MSLEFAALEAMRRQHPAWRLLAADSAPLVASFLDRAFVEPNVRSIGQADLAEALEDTLYALREQRGPDAYPKAALDYLNDWAANDKGWLRKFYRPGSDEPHFDLTPAAEKAIAWLGGLAERSFVGTESRLLTLFELLRQMDEGTDADPAARLRDLERRRAEIDGEIERVRQGDIALMGDTALKERFQQFVSLARELLADFREIEHNFRMLDRRVRERIALWDGHKGELLQDVLGERDLIADSDQGRSFRAFWDFLMSQARQEELTRQLDRVLKLAPVLELAPDARLRRVHYDWLEAGEHAQRTVALLSQQLRRFLDDQAWLENRRIMDMLRGVEAAALALREVPPSGEFMTIAETAATLELPFERPLHATAAKTAIARLRVEVGDEDMDAAALYSQFVVDKGLLAQRIGEALMQLPQITLADLLARHPLQKGLAELVAYLQLATERGAAVVDDADEDQVAWRSPAGVERRARLPRVIFSR